MAWVLAISQCLGCTGSLVSPEITSVEPTWVLAGRSAQVRIRGHRFTGPLRIDLGSHGPGQVESTSWSVTVGSASLGSDLVTWESSTSLLFTLPADLPLGVHAIGVQSSSGLRASLAAALTIASSPPVDDSAEAGAATTSAADAAMAGTEPGPQVDDAGLLMLPNAQGDAGLLGLPSEDAAAQLPPPCDPLAFGAPELLSITGWQPYSYAPNPQPDGVHLLFSAYASVDEDLYWSARVGTGAVFSSPTAIGSLNSSADDGSPHLSADGQTLYFYSSRAGGQGGRDLWRALRVVSPGFVFQSPEPVVELNSASQDHLPSLSTDELTIYFASTRAGSQGEDLWVAARSARNTSFSAPERVTELDTAGLETSPNLSRDGRTLYFVSDRGGNADIWAATRANATEPFGTPVPLAQLSSSANERDPAIAADDQELFFYSGRTGQGRIWRSTRVCP